MDTSAAPSVTDTYDGKVLFEGGALPPQLRPHSVAPPELRAAMRLEFVNHSSYVLASSGVRLLCDPWLEGTAFNDGWALLAPSTFSYEDFAGITHLWFSHEHPDHFSPSNLRKIAP